MSKDKKSLQLGMNPSTASGRLLKDILFKLVNDLDQNVCHQCGCPMTRETFSIEHIVPWLDSEDPQKLFFDMNNISFSHLRCNIKAARSKPAAACGTSTKYNQQGCRCDLCKSAKSTEQAKYYTKGKRKERYLKEGR